MSDNDSDKESVISASDRSVTVSRESTPAAEENAATSVPPDEDPTSRTGYFVLLREMSNGNPPSVPSQPTTSEPPASRPPSADRSDAHAVAEPENTWEDDSDDNDTEGLFSTIDTRRTPPAQVPRTEEASPDQEGDADDWRAQQAQQAETPPQDPSQPQDPPQDDDFDMAEFVESDSDD